MKNLFPELFLSSGVNYFSDDQPLQAVMDFFSIPHPDELKELGSYVSEELIELLDYIDHHGKPSLHTWGIMGNRIDFVRLSPEHRRALLKLQKLGTVGSMLRGSGSLMQHFLSGYIISDSGIFCTLTLTAQTAYGLRKYGSGSLRDVYLQHFSDPAEPWFGATFYTETQGGSDLGANTTAAVPGDGAYRLRGSEKYFASDVGIADAAIVTARAAESPGGARGISVFFVPAYLPGGEQNYTIRRLKDKHGTIAVPTGEVEFSDSVAYPLGKEGEGIYIAMEILTISRIDDAIAAVGIARKALWEAYLYTGKRMAFGKPLRDHPLMMRDLVELESELEASTVISVLAAKLFDEARDTMPPYNSSYQYARLLSNVAKSMAAETSAAVTRYCMEIQGGSGFLEEFPMAKFHRDAIVTSIWEGTGNIQALEFLEVLGRKNGLTLLMNDIQDSIRHLGNSELPAILAQEAASLEERRRGMLSSSEPQFMAKELLMDAGRLVSAVYMLKVAGSGANGSGIIGSSAEFYIRRHYGKHGINGSDIIRAAGITKWMDR